MENDFNVSTTNLTSVDNEDDAETGSEIIIAKIVTMCVLCLVSTCVGLVPMQLAKWFKWTSNEISPRSVKVIEMLLGFGGGVLLSTTFLHILPEVSERIEELGERDVLPSLNVSWAEFFMCCGFFLMYLVEELVHIYLRKNEKRREQSSDTMHHIGKDDTKSTNDLVENGQVSAQPKIENRNSYGHGHSHIPLPENDDDNVVVSSLRGLLVVLGLSVHELFEGLAIGVSRTATDVWYLFGAVAAHKFVIAFCIGIELISSRTRFFLIVIYVFTYSVVSPIGIGIAMILTSDAEDTESELIIIILQGLAAGTLLYVVFFEILRKQRHGIRQYLSVLIGFLLMFTIQVTSSHSHSHSHGHGHGHSNGNSHGHSHGNIDEVGHDDHEGHDHDDHSHQHDHRENDAIRTTISAVTDKVFNVISATLASPNVSEEKIIT